MIAPIDAYYIIMGILENLLLLNIIDLFLHTKEKNYKYITWLLLMGNTIIFRNTDITVYVVQFLILSVYVLFCCTYAPVYVKLTVPFLLFACLLLLDVLFISICSHVIENNEKLIDPQSYFNVISNVLSRLILLGIYLVLRTRKLYQGFIRKAQWILFCISTILVVCMIFIIYDILLYHDLDTECMILLSFVLFLYLIFLFYVFSLSMSQEKLKITQLEEQVMDRNTKLSNEIIKSYEENRILRHDLKQHLSLLYVKLEKGNITEAMRSIEQLTSAISSIAFINTQNKALNDILNVKIHEMKEQNIQFHYHIGNNLLWMEEMDLIILLGNLIDNAIEAQAEVSQQRSIEVDIYEKNIFIIIRIRNTYNLDKTKRKGKYFYSYKNDKKYHGLGLISVEKVVAQYQGTMQFQEENNVFETIITIPK